MDEEDEEEEGGRLRTMSWTVKMRKIGRMRRMRTEAIASAETAECLIVSHSHAMNHNGLLLFVMRQSQLHESQHRLKGGRSLLIRRPLFVLI